MDRYIPPEQFGKHRTSSASRLRNLLFANQHFSTSARTILWYSEQVLTYNIGKMMLAKPFLTGNLTNDFNPPKQPNPTYASLLPSSSSGGTWLGGRVVPLSGFQCACASALPSRSWKHEECPQLSMPFTQVANTKASFGNGGKPFFSGSGSKRKPVTK